MASLGNVGYGIYRLNRKHLLVLGPGGAKIVPLRSNLQDHFDLILEEMSEEDIFMDHKINTGGHLE